MTLTAEQRDAVLCHENLYLTACPGSGKTRVIISKLSRVIEEVRETPRTVACITYTNAAVQEIETRLRFHIQPGDDAYYDICTIHSFCLNHIFRPFCHLIEGYERGFKVLGFDSAEFAQHVTSVCRQFGRHNLQYKDFDDFAQLRVSSEGKPTGSGIEHGAITSKVAEAYWRKIRGDGFVDFANIIYFSFVLLRDHPEILSYVSAKFAWFLVDEFQDTTDLQVEILSLIAATGRTRFLLVGDPCQSIFRFAGAKPELASGFAESIRARSDIQLSRNFRSSAPIVAHANLLYPRTPAMKAIVNTRRSLETPQRKDGASAFTVITDHFLPALESRNIPIGDAAILAPSWYPLFPLGRRLREYGVSVTGPGARPYRRNSTFAPLAEQICGHLMDARPEAIAGIERTLFHTLLDVTGRACFDIFSYRGRKVVFRLLDRARKLQSIHMGATSWLEVAAKDFAEILLEEEYLTLNDRNVFAMSVQEMKADMQRNKVDIANMLIDDLGIYASPRAALKLVTLHHAKGREYQAVAIIDLHEGKLPHYQARTAADVEQSRNLFYVGITRAKSFLVYVTDKTGQRNGPSRFLRAGTGIGVC